MFTGLIKDIGTIKKVIPNATGKEFIIETKLISEIKPDDSVATNGVCLTATKIEGSQIHMQAVHVTLEKTSIGHLKPGSKVNLELALRPIDRLGGHFVQGHVNGTGKMKSVKKLGNNYEVEITPPKALFKYFINEGSVALDGISLTIAKVLDTSFVVSIIPHTWDHTILHTKKVGDTLNIEVDMMAKYLENFMKFQNNDKKLMDMI